MSAERRTNDAGTVAYCGVDCAACTDFVLRECPGCRATVWKDGDVCMPVRCCRDRGIEVCAGCGGFPCAEMRGFYRGSPSHREAYVRMLDARSEAHGGRVPAPFAGMKVLDEDETDRHFYEIRTFVRLAYEDEKDEKQITEIVKSVGVNSVFICKLLVTLDDFDITAESGKMPLSFVGIALHYRSEWLLRLLLGLGADPNGTDEYGRTPLWELRDAYLCPEFALRAARLFLDHGADANAVWKQGGFRDCVKRDAADDVFGEDERTFLTALSLLLDRYAG